MDAIRQTGLSLNVKPALITLAIIYAILRFLVGRRHGRELATLRQRNDDLYQEMRWKKYAWGRDDGDTDSDSDK